MFERLTPGRGLQTLQRQLQEQHVHGMNIFLPFLPDTQEHKLDVEFEAGISI